MNDDPLSQLQRQPRAPSASRMPPGNGHAAVGVGEHPVAPVWIGECLRLAGEAWNPSLILRQREGRVTALAYSYLTAVRFDPSASLELDFVGYAVTVSGRRLTSVFEALAAQRCMELAESPSNVEEDESAPFIDTIAVISTQER